MKLPELLSEMPDEAPMKLAILNVQTALIVSKVMLHEVQGLRAGNAEVVRLANMLLDQEAYFNELTSAEGETDDVDAG